MLVYQRVPVLGSSASLLGLCTAELHVLATADTSSGTMVTSCRCAEMRMEMPFEGISRARNGNYGLKMGKSAALEARKSDLSSKHVGFSMF